MGSEKILEIQQKEWALLNNTGKTKQHILATSSLRYCTCFYGYDKNMKVGFLAHYDHFSSPCSLPDIFYNLSFHITPSSGPICVFMGGGWYLLSWFTRLMIKYQIRKVKKNTTWNICLTEEEYTNKWKFYGMQLDTKTGDWVDYNEKIEIRRVNKFTLKAKCYSPQLS